MDMQLVVATYKFIQANSLYNEFNIVASAPMSEAYDMSEITADYSFINSYSQSGYVVYLVNSMEMVFSNLYVSVQQHLKSKTNISLNNFEAGGYTFFFISKDSEIIHKNLVVNYDAF